MSLRSSALSRSSTRGARPRYSGARGFSTAKKRKPTKKQLAALAKGRRALAQKYK